MSVVYAAVPGFESQAGTATFWSYLFVSIIHRTSTPRLYRAVHRRHTQSPAITFDLRQISSHGLVSRNATYREMCLVAERITPITIHRLRPCPVCIGFEPHPGSSALTMCLVVHFFLMVATHDRCCTRETRGSSTSSRTLRGYILPVPPCVRPRMAATEHAWDPRFQVYNMIKFRYRSPSLVV